MVKKMPPPQMKLYRDKSRKEEIPFVGFPDEAVEMGVEGKIEVYVVNQAEHPYIVTEAWHDNSEASIVLESERLDPFMPVKVTLRWKPPVTEDQEKWKPLKGNINLKGYHLIG